MRQDPLHGGGEVVAAGQQSLLGMLSREPHVAQLLQVQRVHPGDRGGGDVGHGPSRGGGGGGGGGPLGPAPGRTGGVGGCQVHFSQFCFNHLYIDRHNNKVHVRIHI